MKFRGRITWKSHEDIVAAPFMLAVDGHLRHGNLLHDSPWHKSLPHIRKHSKMQLLRSVERHTLACELVMCYLAYLPQPFAASEGVKVYRRLVALSTGRHRRELTAALARAPKIWG